MRDSSAVNASAMPSVKYSWSGSFDRLTKGSTAIDRTGASTLGSLLAGHPINIAAADAAPAATSTTIAAASHRDVDRAGATVAAGVTGGAATTGAGVGSTISTGTRKR